MRKQFNSTVGQGNRKKLTLCINKMSIAFLLLILLVLKFDPLFSALHRSSIGRLPVVPHPLVHSNCGSVEEFPALSVDPETGESFPDGDPYSLNGGLQLRLQDGLSSREGS